ncbi:unnamed protein product [Chrysoparadoxa australica]
MVRRVDPKVLVELRSQREKLRNICILAHVDHGKTTLADGLVCSNGIISNKLAGKLRYLDSTEDEQKRGITMKSSAISLLHSAQARSKQASNSDENGSSDYLINLIDSPGHIDFSSDVSTATRLCDGALVVVDVLEGVCAQTHAVLRQAWNEQMRPLLVLNKIDRLVCELQLTPLEAWQQLQRLVEHVNALTATFVAAASAASDGDGDIAPEQADLDDIWTFSPERGDVVFCSALDGWAFGLSRFAKIWAKRLGAKPRALRQMLWGEYVYVPKQKKVIPWTRKGSSNQLPMFVTMILEPIWQLYSKAGMTGGKMEREKVEQMALALQVAAPVRELQSADPRVVVQSVMRRWLPVAEAVLDMVVELCPSPIDAQGLRRSILMPDPVSSQAPEIPEHVHEEWIKVRDALATCDSSPAAPVVVFVSKMVPVKRGELLTTEGALWRPPGEDSSVAVERSDFAFVAFARIFSGTLHPDSEIHILGPKYDPSKPECHTHATALATTVSLFMMMGSSLHPGMLNVHLIPSLTQSLTSCLLSYLLPSPVDSVPAGNVLAIAGLENVVHKSATLSSTLSCPALRPLIFQAKPMVRVAVETPAQSDMKALESGLAKLNQADPAVQVSVTAKGEHILSCVGELHLEQCLKELREQYAGVAVTASAPLISFRETVIREVDPSPGQGAASQRPPPPQLGVPPWSKEEGLGGADVAGYRVRAVTAGSEVAVTIRCAPLPVDLTKLLEARHSEVKAMLGSNLAADTSAVYGLLVEALEAEAQELRAIGAVESETGEGAGTSWIVPFISRIMSCGPRSMGANLLMKAVGMSVVTSSEKLEEGPPVCNSESGSSMSADSGATEEQRERIWRLAENSILTGFHMAAGNGPLAGEDMYGVLFEVEVIEGYTAGLGLSAAGNSGSGSGSGNGLDQASGVAPEVTLTAAAASSTFGPLSGQIMSVTKAACRAAFLCCPVRLVEAFYACSLQCDQSQMGNMYSVLSKRRGRVVSEDLVEGTQLFLLEAYLPLAESFGFANDILKRTSGAGMAPQLSFSHWEALNVDPFWRPQTEEEREDEGEHGHIGATNLARGYIDLIRKRKGLESGEKVVVAAEKQRTLTRMK